MDHLLGEISEILNGILGKALRMVFVEWEKWLQICIDVGGESIEEIITDSRVHAQQTSKGVDMNFKRNILYRCDRKRYPIVRKMDE
jgi:hypothetical protein